MVTGQCNQNKIDECLYKGAPEALCFLLLLIIASSPLLIFQRLAFGNLIHQSRQRKGKQENDYTDSHTVAKQTGILLAVHIA